MDSLQKRLKEITHDLADSPLPPKRIKLREEERYILKMINNSHETAAATAELAVAKAKLASTKTNIAAIVGDLQRETYHDHIVGLEKLCATLGGVKDKLNCN
jgi:dihydroorotate dehydrogenase